MTIFTVKSKHLKTLQDMLRPNRREFLLALLLIGLSSAVMMLVPLWAKILINEIILKKDLFLLFKHLMWGFLLFLCILFFEFERESRKLYLGNAMEAGVRTRLFQSIICVPLSIMPEHQTGDLISRISNDVRVFGDGIREGIFNLVSNAMMVLGLGIMMLWYSVTLTLVTTLLVSPTAWAIDHFVRRIRSKSLNAQEKLASVNNMVEESIRGLREIKCYGQEESVAERFSRLNEETLQAHNRQDRLRAINPAIVSCQTFITIGILIFVCSWMVFRGFLPIADLTAFITCLLLVFTPISRISSSFGLISKVFAAMDRFDDVLHLPKESIHAEQLPSLPTIKGHILAKDVSFSYSQKGFRMEDISFEIMPGETIAIVGPSGAGKTTLVNLLLRFLDPMSGTILMDGRDIHQHRIDSLRRQIGLVSQEPVLFDATLRENLSFGKVNATNEEIRAAARAAHVDQFARKLPNGYDTPIGQYGGRLSVGQRQRIAIARAFLLNPRLLILDEPTSALDPESERLISDSLRTLWQGRTTIIIAHRMSTVRNVDRIIVLDNGRIVQNDTRRNLLKEDGLFQRLYAYAVP
jgi:subfamily B ATP-binding cassette protein MsbA